jgi:Tol biopolymer transport system component
MSDRDGDWEIFIVDADGTNEQKLTNNAAGDLHPTFSPDGTRIAFESDRTGNVEILTMNVDGTAARNRTKNPATDLRPAFSPDGGEIAFDTNRDGNREIYTMNADGSNQVNRSRNPLSDDQVPDWGVRIDRPRVAAAGFPRQCTSRSFRARVRVVSADSRHKATVLLDGKRIAKTRRTSVKLRVPARRLRRGRHRVSVIVRDAAGNRTRRSFRFRRCAPPL